MPDSFPPVMPGFILMHAAPVKHKCKLPLPFTVTENGRDQDRIGWTFGTVIRCKECDRPYRLEPKPNGSGYSYNTHLWFPLRRTEDNIPDCTGCEWYGERYQCSTC